jgi:nucleoside-diphosphate-sugar epimerase
MRDAEPRGHGATRTSATGFIGSYFCRAFQAAGHEVVGIDRPTYFAVN